MKFKPMLNFKNFVPYAGSQNNCFFITVIPTYELPHVVVKNYKTKKITINMI